MEIKVGDRVKSYDFPDNDPERRERCYVEGTVLAIGPAPLGYYDCDRYTIEVEEVVFDGKRENVSINKGRVYPPVNGTPTFGGRVTDGVVKIF